MSACQDSSPVYLSDIVHRSLMSLLDNVTHPVPGGNKAHLIIDIKLATAGAVDPCLHVVLSSGWQARDTVSSDSFCFRTREEASSNRCHRLSQVKSENVHLTVRTTYSIHAKPLLLSSSLTWHFLSIELKLRTIKLVHLVMKPETTYATTFIVKYWSTSIHGGTAAAAPPPFRPGNPALWEPSPSHPILV